MQIRSLGYRTDLIFARFEGIIIDRGEYLVIRTPSNPNFFWGNFLLFAPPPQMGDFERWKALFAQEIGAQETGNLDQVQHFAFGWDSPDVSTEAIAPFLAAGFDLNSYVVLTARQVRKPSKFNPEVQVRTLVSEEDWEQATLSEIASRDPRFSLEGFTSYQRAKMASYRAMSDQGLGHWFGAFVGDQLAGSLGLFVDKLSGKTETLGRFQAVATYPDFRRQGVCATLVYKAALYALTSMDVETLVMVADEEYFAARIYESVGFQPTERQFGLQWFQKQNDSANSANNQA